MYFNSIKVRLEHAIRHTHDIPAKFQFHKGTIRTTEIEHKLVIFLHFNSIKVRLELRLASLILLAELFQFHKGTIRTHKICNDHYTYRQISIP